MKFIYHRYYTTFVSIEIEADTQLEAEAKADEVEELSTEEIMSNLERWEECDHCHPAELEDETCQERKVTSGI